MRADVEQRWSNDVDVEFRQVLKQQLLALQSRYDSVFSHFGQCGGIIQVRIRGDYIPRGDLQRRNQDLAAFGKKIALSRARILEVQSLEGRECLSLSKPFLVELIAHH